MSELQKKVEAILQQNVSGYRIGGASAIAGWILQAVVEEVRVGSDWMADGCEWCAGYTAAIRDAERIVCGRTS